MKDIEPDVGSMVLMDEDGRTLVSVYANAFPGPDVKVDLQDPSTIPAYREAYGCAPP